MSFGTNLISPRAFLMRVGANLISFWTFLIRSGTNRVPFGAWFPAFSLPVGPPKVRRVMGKALCDRERWRALHQWCFLNASGSSGPRTGLTI